MQTAYLADVRARVAALPWRVCPHCQTDYRRGWPLDEDDCCFDCWIQPLSEEGARWQQERLQSEGLLPVEFIGC